MNRTAITMLQRYNAPDNSVTESGLHHSLQSQPTPLDSQTIVLVTGQDNSISLFTGKGTHISTAFPNDAAINV